MGPIKRSPNFIELLFLFRYFTLIIVLSSLHIMRVDAQSGGQDLIAELPLPKPLILNHVGVSKAHRKINIKIFDGPRDLFLESALLLFNANDILVRGPIAFHIFERLFEEKWHILRLVIAHSQALYKNVAVLLKVLLKEHNTSIYLIEGLQQTLLVVTYLCQNVLVQPHHRLLVVHRSQNQVVIVLKGLSLCQSQINIVGSTYKFKLLIVRTIDTVLLYPIGSHNRSIPFL
mgnify:CR=1 FL=1